jgi:uncharacterized protein with gpF-like domain
MLINVHNDKVFQNYLDEQELKLFRSMLPLLVATMRLHVNRNHVRAHDYFYGRGIPLLVHTYKRIYADQFDAISRLEKPLVERMINIDETKASARSRFLEAQSVLIEQRAGRQIVDISNTTRREITDIITDMAAEGKHSTAIARAIQAAAPGLARGRASAIARTEVHTAATEAINESMKHKHLTYRTKTWHAAGDNRVRPSHAAASGQTVYFDEAFAVGDSEMMYPGDASLGAGAEEIVNCRCSVLYHVDELEPGDEGDEA